MFRRHAEEVLRCAKSFQSKRSTVALLESGRLYHCTGETHEEVLPFGWYENVFPKMTELAHQLQNVDLIDGRLVNINDDIILRDARIESKMHTLKKFVTVFIGSPLVQEQMKNKARAFSADHAECKLIVPFAGPDERQPMIVDSLTKVSNFLNVSAQQRKLVRHTICPQVTQHRIWTGALEEMLNGLKSDMDRLNHAHSSKGSSIGLQIISSCLQLLVDTDTCTDHDAISWMRLGSAKGTDSPSSSKWEDVLEMFKDLILWLANEKDLVHHVKKLEVMKEGLYQIKDVLIDKSIGYKEVRHQESLVQKKLSKTLGHSSRCLFTLLLYYLYGSIGDIEVDVCGGLHAAADGNKFTLCMGRILASDEDKMVWRGVKQLDRALGLFKFVWETAGMKGNLELQGHLWCVGAEDRIITYRGSPFFVHGICFQELDNHFCVKR